ncbi:RNA polymerase sigma factor [Bailinhaonella thermotolerans]|uniref:Sigma-70 family RNA polymerase sigma factor n=1 Tax=Bailinhaonella thermotolerans TaxID=1070861 RepID=A0A3A4B740_9ACTN|nr:sigma-70 family RNA polymerase sigma factor [Bailinhaonella thermotolerans]RJL34387.1 sigma-70 family RNA polymerase sigma factor [Bailinhaonella thermotolerans]
MSELRTLIAAAREGDARAWGLLVGRFDKWVWANVRSYGLAPYDAADAVQTTWLRLVERLDSIRDPDRLPGWLATTAGNEAAALRRRRRGEHLCAAPPECDSGEDVVTTVLTADTVRKLRQAVGELSEPCRSLLRLLLDAQQPTYAELAERLGMPVGSVGPTRARCLARLRAIVSGANP